VRCVVAVTCLSLLACSSSISSGTPSTDAGASDATADASVVDAGGDATTSDSGGDVASEATVDPCGPVGSTWSRCVANPVARSGFQQSDGRYELSIGDPDVQYDATAGLWKAWWSTGLAASYTDTPQLGIKYATSTDGVAWDVQPALTIESRTGTNDWDTLNLETPTLLILPNNPPDRKYLLFYSGAGIKQTVNGASIPWYQIGLAFSADGTSFTRLPVAESPYATATTPYGNVEGLLLLGRDAFPGLANVADGSIADPEVAFDGTTIHLYFSSLAVDASGTPLAFGLSHATSTDGTHWTVAGGNPVAALNGGKGPSIVQGAGGSWELYFQRDTAADTRMVPSTFNPQLGIWTATSTDLTTWTVDNSARVLEWAGSYASEAYGWIAVGDMALVGGQHRYYYPAFSTLMPPASNWVVPLQDGGFSPSLIVLDMARRD
jgi:hypothetical protein